MYSESLKATYRRFVIVVVFGAGLGYIEAAVVVYLRALFYSEGFTFPLAGFADNPLGNDFLRTEVIREAATLVVLFTSCWLVGNNFQSRLAYFLTIFGVWDIFYYVWLKILLDWPVSLMDWDVLFLIPVTWTGPVLAPIMISLMMIFFALVILYRHYQARPIQASQWHTLGFALAGLIIIGNFCRAGLHMTELDFRSYFHWPLFIAALIFAFLLFLRIVLHQRNTTTSSVHKQR